MNRLPPEELERAEAELLEASTIRTGRLAKSIVDFAMLEGRNLGASDKEIIAALVELTGKLAGVYCRGNSNNTSLCIGQFVAVFGVYNNDPDIQLKGEQIIGITQ